MHTLHSKNDVIDKMAAEHSPLYASAAAAAAAVRNSPQLQDQIRKQEGASEMQLGQFLDIPHKPMQRHRSRIVLQPPGSAGSINVRHFVFSDLKKDDMDDTMDILLQNENQGPVACSSRQTTPQKKYQHQIYDANALSDFSASRSDPLVFERKHYNTPNNSLIESLKDPIETQVNIQSPGNNAEVFTEPVSYRKKNKILHATPYNVKRVQA
ncbi:unnamed protein product [Meganyctiphanes norvegica]|uniref:Uncharacterized protein n=1 Tax=Meganyctiphanes norvegica TaxID=48144 RepID=A0AAV2QRY3_MEGNR